MMNKIWKVKVPEGVGYKFGYKNKSYSAGEEFLFEGPRVPPHLEMIEEMEPVLGIQSKAEADPQPHPPVDMDKPPVASETIKTPGTIVATPEGTEVVATFDPANASPQSIKSIIAQTEASQPKVVEGDIGAPAANRFEIQDKGRGWYQVVDTESGAIVSDKSLREDDAKALVTQLTEAAAASAE